MSMLTFMDLEDTSSKWFIQMKTETILSLFQKSPISRMTF